MAQAIDDISGTVYSNEMACWLLSRPLIAGFLRAGVDTISCYASYAFTQIAELPLILEGCSEIVLAFS